MEELTPLELEDYLVNELGEGDLVSLVVPIALEEP